MKKIRDSRFELIRIISMIFIIMAHYNLYGNWSGNIIHNFKMELFRPWGQVGVCLFVMITSYFMSNKDTDLKLSFSRNKKLWIKTIYYSWLILILTFVFNPKLLGLKQIILAIFPVISGEYWFITSYIILIFLLPFLNLMVKKSDKSELQKYIGIIIVATDIMPNIQKFNVPLGGTMSVGAMLAPYLVAAYIRKYNFKLNNLKNIFIIMVGVLLEYLSIFIMSKHSNDPAKFSRGLLPLVIGTGIFLLFVNCKPFHSKTINWLASGVLASYLITEHPLFRYTFWDDILNVSKFQNPVWLFVLMGLIIALISVILGSVIDHIYQWGYKKIILRRI